jgi:hypothetical protein
MGERLGFPHPSPLPVGEGAKGVSLRVSTLIVVPMLSQGKIQPRGEDRTCLCESSTPASTKRLRKRCLWYTLRWRPTREDATRWASGSLVSASHPSPDVGGSRSQP